MSGPSPSTRCPVSSEVLADKLIRIFCTSTTVQTCCDSWWYPLIPRQRWGVYPALPLDKISAFNYNSDAEIVSQLIFTKYKAQIFLRHVNYLCLAVTTRGICLSYRKRLLFNSPRSYSSSLSLSKLHSMLFIKPDREPTFSSSRTFLRPIDLWILRIIQDS